MTGRKIVEYVVRAALLIAGILIVRHQLAKRAESIATNELEEAALPESVQASAVYQRFGARRTAVEAMRADLRSRLPRPAKPIRFLTSILGNGLVR